jgi:hypothetical protein
MRRLQKAIIVVGNTLGRTERDHFDRENYPSHSCHLACNLALLSRSRDNLRVSYGSPIALRLSTHWEQPAIELAQEIVTYLPAAEVSTPTLQPAANAIWQHLLLSVTADGWIQFDLTDAGIALWLQTIAAQILCLNREQLPDNPELRAANDKFFIKNSDKLFEIQYTHARCCSLLRLNNGAALLRRSFEQIAEPDASLWLAADGALVLQQPVERRLMTELIAVVDDLADTTWSNCQRAVNLASLLSDRFQAFHAACRISSSAKLQQRLWAQLELTRLTQTVLQSVLRNWLQLDAPCVL